MRPKYETSKPLEPTKVRQAAAQQKMSRTLDRLAEVLREVDLETEAMTVPERAALVRRAMESRGADDALDNFVSWFELEE